MQAESFGLKTSPRRSLAVAVLALLAAGCAHKESKPAAPAPEAPQPAASAPKPVMDQHALDLLKRMSDTLAAAKTFSYRSHGMAEFPAHTGQFLTFFGDTEVALERPNKLRGKVSGDMPPFHIVYDGSKVSAYDPEKNLYAVTDAPATIDETLKLLIEKSGIDFPASDILSSDPYAVMTRGVDSAFVVGSSVVEGFPCEHLAFMGPGVNWEIWIDSGKTPVPRRFAVTYKEATNFPRFMVEFSNWKLNPKFPAGQFAFKPPAQAKQIEFAAQSGSGIKKLEEEGGGK